MPKHPVHCILIRDSALCRSFNKNKTLIDKKVGNFKIEFKSNPIGVQRFLHVWDFFSFCRYILEQTYKCCDDEATVFLQYRNFLLEFLKKNAFIFQEMSIFTSNHCRTWHQEGCCLQMPEYPDLAYKMAFMAFDKNFNIKAVVGVNISKMPDSKCIINELKVFLENHPFYSDKDHDLKVFR